MDEEERQAWIEDVKRRLGLVAISSDEEEPPAKPEWPVLEEGARYEVVSEHAMVSYDGVNFHVKPDGVSSAEWLASLP